MIHETSSFSRDSLQAFSKNFLKENMLLFDIETTGLSPSRDSVYCIGCGYLSGNDVRVELFFAEARDEEAEILKTFSALAQTYPVWITFNGTTFDLPFLSKRFSDVADCSEFNLSGSHIDLYREARAMRCLLGLSAYKQKSIEQFLGISRDDIYTGGELIEFYKRYASGHDPELLEPILLHNREDVIGMFDLLEILSYRQFSDGKFTVTGMTEEGDRFLSIKLRPEMPLPQSICRTAGTDDGISFLLGRESALVKIPIRHGILKRFFDDPENYYYLPDEDTAVHKSVGRFVDPSRRVRATKKTCYVKKDCDYLAIPYPYGSSLRREYEDSDICVELPADWQSLKSVLAGYFSRFM